MVVFDPVVKVSPPEVPAWVEDLKVVASAVAVAGEGMRRGSVVGTLVGLHDAPRSREPIAFESEFVIFDSDWFVGLLFKLRIVPRGVGFAGSIAKHHRFSN